MSWLSCFQRDDARHGGVRPIQIVLLRITYALMGFVMARTAWTSLLHHAGPWDPYRAMAHCVWAAYGTLGLLGLLRPLRMLPIVLFMIFYKSLWLAVVAYPLWRAGALAGSASEELAVIFLAAPAFVLCVPWRYVVRRFLLPSRGMQGRPSRTTSSAPE